MNNEDPVQKSLNQQSLMNDDDIRRCSNNTANEHLSRKLSVMERNSSNIISSKGKEADYSCKNRRKSQGISISKLDSSKLSELQHGFNEKSALPSNAGSHLFNNDSPSRQPEVMESNAKSISYNINTVKYCFKVFIILNQIIILIHLTFWFRTLPRWTEKKRKWR